MTRALSVKSDFPIFTEHPELVYLDSAATSQKPQQVIDAVVEHYRTRNSNVRRGIYKIADEATRKFEEVREAVAKFIGAASPAEIIFTRNATESVNLVAHAWGRVNLREGDEILVTLMEHHANIVPWQLLANERGVKLQFVGITDDGRLDENDVREKITSRTKLACFTHASNVLGTINDAKRLTALFHARGIPVLVDGAQAVPHLPVNISDIGCDFYVLSSHKMLGPSGVGVLYINSNVAKNMPPFLGGGEMIRSVSWEETTYQDPPGRFEAGTPAIEAAVGFGAAVKYLEKIGMEKVRQHEIELLRYAREALGKIPGIRIFGPARAEDRTGVIAFTMDTVHPHDLASLMDAENICIRAGHHCAMPLHTHLGLSATARMSFYIYNNESDVKKAVTVLKSISQVLKNHE